jgi:hypothetical protein
MGDYGNKGNCKCYYLRMKVYFDFMSSYLALRGDCQSLLNML